MIVQHGTFRHGGSLSRSREFRGGEANTAASWPVVGGQYAKDGRRGGERALTRLGSSLARDLS